MDTDIPLYLELNRQKTELSNQFREALDLLAARNNLEGIEEVKNNLQLTPDTCLKTILKECISLWQNFKLPFDSKANFFSMVLIYSQNQQKEKRAKELAKRQEQFIQNQRQPPIFHIPAGNNSLPEGAAFMGHRPLDGNPPISPDSDPLMLDLQKWIVTEGRKTFGISPYTKLPLDRPLTFEHSIQYDSDFAECTVYLPFVKVLNLHKTLQNVLIKAQSLGFTKPQMLVLFSQMVSKFFPAQQFLLDNCLTPNQAFQIMLNLISPSDYLMEITKALDNVKRDPSLSLKTCMDQYQCLVQLKFNYQQPNLSHHQVLVKAQSMARFVLKHFISDRLKTYLDNFIYVRRQNGDTLDLSQLIDFCQQCETQDSSFCLTETATIPPQNRPDMMLFSTQFNRYRSASRSPSSDRSSKPSSRSSSAHSSRYGSKERYRNRYDGSTSRENSTGRNTDKYKDKRHDNYKRAGTFSNKSRNSKFKHSSNYKDSFRKSDRYVKDSRNNKSNENKASNYRYNSDSYTKSYNRNSRDRERVRYRDRKERGRDKDKNSDRYSRSSKHRDSYKDQRHNRYSSSNNSSRSSSKDSKSRSNSKPKTESPSLSRKVEELNNLLQSLQSKNS